MNLIFVRVTENSSTPTPKNLRNVLIPFNKANILGQLIRNNNIHCMSNIKNT